jgi:predicted nucleic acid-binding Zn ribbon protein
MFASNVMYFAAGGFHRPSHEDEEVGEVCIPNISPKERKKREKFAIQQFIFTLIVLVVLLALDVNPLWRLLLFFMFSAATTSYIQSLDKT